MNFTVLQTVGGALTLLFRCENLDLIHLCLEVFAKINYFFFKQIMLILKQNKAARKKVLIPKGKLNI